MSNRLQKEIEEILDRYDKATPRRKRLNRKLRGIGRSLTGLGSNIRLPHISLAQVMFLGIALLFVAFFFSATTPYTIYAGLALFFGAFILSFRKSQYRSEMRWRGRTLDLTQPGPGDRLRRWWQNHRIKRHH